MAFLFLHLILQTSLISKVINTQVSLTPFSEIVSQIYNIARLFHPILYSILGSSNLLNHFKILHILKFTLCTSKAIGLNKYILSCIHNYASYRINYHLSINKSPMHPYLWHLLTFFFIITRNLPFPECHLTQIILHRISQTVITQQYAFKICTYLFVPLQFIC